MPLRGPIEQEVSPRVELGVGYAVPIGDRWEWITELSGDIMIESTGEYDTANIASGGRFHFGDDEQWAFNVALRLDVSHNDLDDTSPIGGLVGISYSSPTRRKLIPRGEQPPPPPLRRWRRRRRLRQHRRLRHPRLRRRRTPSRCARPAPATDW